MRKLSIIALCVLLFTACSKEDETTPEYVIPENDVKSVKERIDLESNQELVTYSVISKDSIWGLSKEVE